MIGRFVNDDEFPAPVAIPCLRDRNIRNDEVGKSVEDKERKIIAGIRNHYR